jgi:hypothetical protein
MGFRITLYERERSLEYAEQGGPGMERACLVLADGGGRRGEQSGCRFECRRRTRFCFKKGQPVKHFTLADILLRIEKEKLKDLDRTAKQQRRVVIDYAKHLGCPEEALEDREFYNRMRLESLVKYHARRLLSEYACSYGDFRPARKDRRAIARTIHDHLLAKWLKAAPELAEEIGRRKDDLFWAPRYLRGVPRRAIRVPRSPKASSGMTIIL